MLCIECKNNVAVIRVVRVTNTHTYGKTEANHPMAISIVRESLHVSPTLTYLLPYCVYFSHTAFLLLPHWVYFSYTVFLLLP